MSSKHGAFRKILVFGLRAVLVLIALLAGLILSYRFIEPTSTLMLARNLTGKPVVRHYVPLKAIAWPLLASVIASEDAKFCGHGGVDWNALFSVIDKDSATGPTRGASTIAMQTAKNLFLWPSRSMARKAIEIPIALSLDLAWPKRRVIEVYLNIAEWGDGVFGIEAAAQHYFQKPAAGLDWREAALLATALPNPILRNPLRPSPRHRALASRLSRRVHDPELNLKCVGQVF
jgi:monofunctional biosynthetic peptidoglycan transglycosylase